MKNVLRVTAIMAAITLTGAAAFVSVRKDANENAPRTLVGATEKLGNGEARVYVDVGPDQKPVTIGVVLDEGAMRGLPTRMNSTNRCFDKNQDAKLTHGECMGDYQLNLPMPAGAAELGLPYKYAMVNWNAEGHMAPAPPVWSAPHFDFHFYLVDPAQIDAIRTGPCAELIDCDDFKRASKPLPSQHHPAGYIDVGAAVAAMGNHLVDSKDPELADPTRGFSSTFIYGTYDAKLIFLEPMVSHSFLASKPDRCTPLSVPEAFATSGYYPTKYCVRYDAPTSTYRIALEGLVYRQAN